MSVDALVHATASLSLQYQCCDHCCKPIFFFLLDDPSEEMLSRSSRCKFYVVKKGSVGSEGIYTDWCVSMLDYIHATDAENCRDVAKTKNPCAIATIATTANHALTTPPTINAHTGSGRIFNAPITRKPFHTDNGPKILSHVRKPARQAEAELLSAAGATLLIGNSLQDVEDDDEVTLVGRATFYRVFGSPRVHTSRDTVIPKLFATDAAGLLVGHSLAAIENA
ncbi:hypothetical protein B0H14DRAFT_3520902 [Mycena olivaceomarginata]|nr:hypothetical protein B0H14DRAFT_3520902 [Mycena olivaceomarginata]